MRYEALRAVVTKGVVGPSPVRGLAVFFRRGLAGWMQAWSGLPPPLASVQEKIEERRAPEEKDEVVLLLVEMAMQAEGYAGTVDNRSNRR